MLSSDILPPRGATGRSWGARSSRKSSGGGKRNTSPAFWDRFNGWAVPVTGPEPASRWMRVSPRAVREVFVQLYEEGLIYRGEYLVNWCPRCSTAISDLEVIHQPAAGKLWHIRYPLSSGDGFLEVATTRPETMLGGHGSGCPPGRRTLRAAHWENCDPSPDGARDPTDRGPVRGP